MVLHARAQDLVGAQAQSIQSDRVDLLNLAPGRVRDDRVQQPTCPQRAIGQLGRKCGVTTLDSGFPQRLRQRKIAESIVDGHRSQDPKDDVPDLVARSLGAALALLMRGATLLVARSARWLVLLCVAAARRLGARPKTCHDPCVLSLVAFPCGLLPRAKHGLPGQQLLLATCPCRGLHHLLARRLDAGDL